jgi:predicted O-methyltransferase YrrM
MVNLNVVNLVARARRKALSILLPRPYESRWGSYSFVGEASGSDPNSRLIDLAIESIGRARSISFSALRDRVGADADAVLERWPGEHYRLLASLCSALAPKTVVEIGTASGMSALAMLSVLPPASRLVSFDVFPWDYRGPDAWGGETLLRRSDFDDGRLIHQVGDLSAPVMFERHRELLSRADFIFVDGPKNDAFERVFLERLRTVHFLSSPIVAFDDIKVWNMLAIWQQIPKPKLDLTSFGHWSGTGLIDWV